MANILIVDDAKEIRVVAALYLAKEGHLVSTVGTASDGLVLLQQRSFDLVILDIDMPEFDGVQMASTLREDSRYRSLPHGKQ